MIFLVYILNVIIRIFCGWGMFYAFISGYFFFASVCLICVLKRNWLTYDPMYGGNIRISINDK